MKKIHSFDEVHDTQQMFRLLLKAMSNPLQQVDIRPYADRLYSSEKAFLAIAFALLDNEVTFCSFENDILDDSIQSLTLSEKVDCAAADFIFVSNRAALYDAIHHAKTGTPADPHKSATIIARIDGDEDATLTMSGPGINKTISLVVDPLVIDAVIKRDEMGFEYPQGIDLIFVDGQNRLFAIPRLAKREG